MPFRPAFDCLWCGTRHVTRAPADLEGWAQLCPACIGRAGDNEFLRFRLRRALEDRTAAAAAAAAAAAETSSRPGGDAEMLAYYQARAPEYDDWYERRGRYAHGPDADAAWAIELEAARGWLAGLPLAGDIVELAAGTGWWSPVLAAKGRLSLYDGADEPLGRARERLQGAGLSAEIQVRDAWAEPVRQVDGLFTGFWLSHVPAARLAQFLALGASWLRPGGVYAFVDSLPDPDSGVQPRPVRSGETELRALADGREFTIVKVHRTPRDYEAALEAAEFREVSVTSTGRFFVLGIARR